MILDKSVYARRKPKAINFDYRTTIRMKKTEAEEFREYYGTGWHEKIRQLMREQLRKDKDNARIEMLKRKKYLHDAYSVKSNEQ